MLRSRQPAGNAIVSPTPTLELEAMQAFALIRYGWCFKGGVRTAFLIPDAWIEALEPQLRQAHREFPG